MNTKRIYSYKHIYRGRPYVLGEAEEMRQYPARELLYMLQKDTRSFLLAILAEFTLTNTENKPNSATRSSVWKKRLGQRQKIYGRSVGGCSFEFLEIIFRK